MESNIRYAAILTLLAVVHFSCGINSSQAVKFVNHSGGEVSDISIAAISGSSSTTSISKISDNDSVEVELAFLPDIQGDGAFELIYTDANGVSDTSSFGYFTNGAPNGTLITIEFQGSFVNIVESFEN